MKNKFLKTFFGVLSEIPEGIDILLSRESLHYKMLRQGGNDPYKIYGGFKNLESRKLIKNIYGNNYRLTSKGRGWFQKQKFKQLVLRDRNWDKKWRVVIFDIPELMRKQRDVFRAKLKSFGFYTFQKSVFVYPFDCQEELGFIGSYLGVGEYVDLIIADSVGFKERVIKEYYGL